MQAWKRNAILATVLVLICAGIYLNWNASEQEPVDLTETLDAEMVMGETVLEEEAEELSSDYFAQIRLSRQESRDSAVEVLQETIAFEDGSDEAAAAVSTLDSLVGDALAESQIESLVIAKGYEDCVAYMSDESINVAVSAPETGLAQSDIALISDIVASQTDYALSDIFIIEVKYVAFFSDCGTMISQDVNARRFSYERK